MTRFHFIWFLSSRLEQNKQKETADEMSVGRTDQIHPADIEKEGRGRYY